MLRVKPSTHISAKVPMMEMGMAIAAMTVRAHVAEEQEHHQRGEERAERPGAP